jgi:hypothetical protein
LLKDNFNRLKSSKVCPIFSASHKNITDKNSIRLNKAKRKQAKIYKLAAAFIGLK